MAGMMGGANHLGVGERPSESHHWVPGMGWVFMPTFEEGNGTKEQALAHEGTDAFQYEVDGKSLADAKASGVTSYGTVEGASGLSSPNIRARQASHALYERGLDHWGGSTEDKDWTLAANNWNWDRKGSPQMSWAADVFEHDRENTFNRFMMDNYNPFLGHEGRWVGDDTKGIGEIDGYSDDSIAAWFKDAFAGYDMIDHRREAINTLGGWNSQIRNPDYESSMGHSAQWIDGAGKGIDVANKRMNKRYFDEMGLGEKFGLEWVDPRQEAYDSVVDSFSSGGTESTGGFMDGYRNQRPALTGGARPSGPPTGGARPSGPPLATPDVFPNESMGGNHLDPFRISQPPQVKPGGFMESYLKKKAENKPSVMSLMTELKDA
jgi:hypothetical protein